MTCTFAPFWKGKDYFLEFVATGADDPVLVFTFSIK